MELQEQWAEALTLLFASIGFIISILLRSILLNYITIIISGFVAGRIFYLKYKKEQIFPFILIIIGFLLGYLVGSFWSSRIITIILFIISSYISYYLHMKKIITTFKSKPFIK